jgi:hypothetical protein
MKVFFHTTPSPTIPHFQHLAECVGIFCEAADVADAGWLSSAMREITSDGKSSFVLDVGSLKNQSLDQLVKLRAYLDECDANVLLLISRADAATDRFLQALTNNSIQGIKLAGCASSVSFPKDAKAFSGELASYAYAREPDDTLGLSILSTAKVDEIMRLDQSATFVRVKAGKANIFVWATKAVFDVQKPLMAEKEFELAADAYIPGIIFLRFAFGDQCWRNPNPGAGIVIDDPLLEKNYGFINFPRLLASARRHHYHVTLAFIPWNHRRSRVGHTRMFLDHADCFGVCVHGCDHTKREFGAADYADLLSRNFVAHQRMAQHQERTGLASQPLMVCPQEQYSLEAMRAFADSRQFAGIVCTACMPRNLTAPGICGADLLLAAQDSFFGMPVFKRHYWNDLSVFAMALFLGKPAILVEHHEFFRNGPGGTEIFAAGLSQIHPGIKWDSLTGIVTRTHLRRRRTSDSWEVRFFTDDFTLEHPGERPADYRLVRRIPAATLINRVTVDGVEIPFDHQGDKVTFGFTAAPRQISQVHVHVLPIQPQKKYSAGIKYRASVSFRRALSEFRDNFIARNDFILRTAKFMAKKLKQTSG